MPPIYLRQGGAWIKAQPWLRQGGKWFKAHPWLRVNGQWETIATPGGEIILPADEFTGSHTSPGAFGMTVRAGLKFGSDGTLYTVEEWSDDGGNNWTRTETPYGDSWAGPEAGPSSDYTISVIHESGAPLSSVSDMTGMELSLSQDREWTVNATSTSNMFGGPTPVTSTCTVRIQMFGPGEDDRPVVLADVYWDFTAYSHVP